MIKRGSNSDKEAQEVFLEREWVQKDNCIPHFANVIKNVDKHEGVEITMNCNSGAFHWIIAFVKIKTNMDDELEAMRKLPAGVSKERR